MPTVKPQLPRPTTPDGHLITYGKPGDSIVLAGKRVRSVYPVIKQRAKRIGVVLEQEMVVIVSGSRERPESTTGLKLTLIDTQTRDTRYRKRR